MCAGTGETTGQRPYSVGAILAAVLAAVAITGLIAVAAIEL